jgi:hypothetical protein
MSKVELKIISGALSVIAAQRSDKPTFEQGGRVKTQDIMPGWLPVINCKMVAALEHTIRCGALHPVLERFQKSQCPTVNPVDAPAVLKIVLGRSTAEQYV